MATSDEEELRALLGETIPEGGSESDTFFTDLDIESMLINAEFDTNRAAVQGWRMKAASYADFVNVTEGNASRAMSDLHGHALAMVKHFQSSNTVTGRTRIGRIRKSI